MLPPFKQTRRRKLASTEKLYFFDIGVANALVGRRELQPGSPEYGKALEQLVFLELHAALEYKRSDAALSYWRTRTNIDVDFLLDDRIAIEVKATRRVTSSDLRPLRIIGDELPLRRRLIVCHEPVYRRTDDGVEIIPVAAFCRELWDGKSLI